MADEETAVEEQTEDSTTEDTTTTHPVLEGQEVTAETGTTETDQQQTGDEQTTPSFTEQLSELGFENVTDDDAQSRILEAYQSQHAELEQLRTRQDELNELAEYGRRHLSELRERRQQDDTTTQQQDPATPEALLEAANVPTDWWSPPKVEQALIQENREYDQTTGEVIWKKGTPAELKQSAEDYASYIQRWANDLTYRPHEVLPPIILKTVQPLVQQMLDRYIQEHDAQNFYDTFEKEHRDFLYQKDPVSGGYTERFTPEAQQVINIAQDLIQGGYSDPEKAWEKAIIMYEGQQAMSAREQTNNGETQQQQRAARKREHLTKTLPSRSGSKTRKTDTSQDSTSTQNKHESRGQQALADYEAFEGAF